jgi:hypothetical protein
MSCGCEVTSPAPPFPPYPPFPAYSPYPPNPAFPPVQHVPCPCQLPRSGVNAATGSTFSSAMPVYAAQPRPPALGSTSVASTAAALQSVPTTLREGVATDAPTAGAGVGTTTAGRYSFPVSSSVTDMQMLLDLGESAASLSRRAIARSNLPREDKVMNGVKAREIGQGYALRAWISSLQFQIEKAQPDLERQIDVHQKEIARLRMQIERSSSVLKSLKTTVEQLDERLRHVHDVDILNVEGQLNSDAKESPSARTDRPRHNAGPAVTGSNESDPGESFGTVTPLKPTKL